MIGSVRFLVPGVGEVSPLYMAPWIGEPDLAGLDPILQGLQGEWPCVPFGIARPIRYPSPRWKPVLHEHAEDAPHGHGSNNPWKLVQKRNDRLVLEIEYPEDHAIKSLRRTIRPMSDRSGIVFELEVSARKDCEFPVGLHPTFALPSEPRTLVLLPGQFEFGLTFPGDFEPGASILEPDKEFESLERVPRLGGGDVDLSRLPLDMATENLVQLVGVDGIFRLKDERTGLHIELAWNPEDFPSCVLWISNRGRTMRPWNGRNLALGVEPVCSAFDLGIHTSAGSNPIRKRGIATVRQFQAGSMWKTSYRIEVSTGIMAGKKAGTKPAKKA